ncbi:hypothetical protein Glove_350g60 [Diversispora epigaea]|uniref:Uncharacterized protein n=1 Tax=Diversispora epigaea TaxID=1348612 RepID=A0A397HCU3_9GLOM|nr:hypothetical protein Glove_350g60 [Diversispora epigaea]
MSIFIDEWHPVHVATFKVHSDYWKKNGENLVLIVKLVDLRDKCLIQQYKLESADEVYELLSQGASRLQELYVKCANGC